MDGRKRKSQRQKGPRRVERPTTRRERKTRTNLGLSGDRGDGADLLLLESVDDGRLSDVRVSDESDRDLLLIRVKDGKLSKQLDERSLSERVVDRGMEREGGGELGEVLDPSSLRNEGSERKRKEVSESSTRREGKRREKEAELRSRRKRRKREKKKRKGKNVCPDRKAARWGVPKGETRTELYSIARTFAPAPGTPHSIPKTVKELLSPPTP